MDRALNITGGGDEVSRFLDEWYADSPYITAHTSGSTGVPKEIRLRKADMEASARATCSFFNITRDSTLYLPLSVAYIAGKMMVVRALLSGAALHIEHPSNQPMQTFDDKVTLLAVVPSQLPSLLLNPRVANVENIIVGGAPMSRDVEHAVAGLSCRVYATYGMTETCSHVALRNVSGRSDVYEALPHVKFAVDDRNCLTVNCSAMSIERLQTNDVVELLSPVSFRWLGRYDNVVNSGGIKLHPELLEKRLGAVIEQPFYLVGRPSERWGQELIMVVEGAADVKKIMDEASEVLHPFEMPKEIFLLSELPKTENGKLRRVIPY